MRPFPAMPWLPATLVAEELDQAARKTRTSFSSWDAVGKRSLNCACCTLSSGGYPGGNVSTTCRSALLAFVILASTALVVFLCPGDGRLSATALPLPLTIPNGSSPAVGAGW